MSAEDRSDGATGRSVEYVPKVCAYVTRADGRQLLVFEGPKYDRLQVPKGTVEPGERLTDAVLRELFEESGIESVGSTRLVASDVWTRRRTADRVRKYLRYFYHLEVDVRRDAWAHEVTGEGEECGSTFRYSWVDLPTSEPLALSLDDYLSRLG